MKIIGGILIAFGIMDIVLSWIGIDVWGEWIGVGREIAAAEAAADLPYYIWFFAGYIETGVGYFIYNLGSDNTEIPTDE